MTLIMDVYGISEVLVNIEDMSGRDIYETNGCAEMRGKLFRIIVNSNNNDFVGQIQIQDFRVISEMFGPPGHG